MTRALNLNGERFGRWTVLQRAQGGSKSKWNCRCDCGAHGVIQGSSLKAGGSKSCGCLVREAMAATGRSNGTHNLSRTPEYRSWSRMIHRCENPKDNRYQYYGERGIKVCERWRSSFEDFLADMGAKPTIQHTIDRFPNTDGNYEPGNCRWATYSEQNRNRRPFKPWTTKLNEDQVRAIRRDPRTARAIGESFGICARQVADIKHRKAWAHVQ